MDPYEQEKRNQQTSMLRGGQPTANTMPVRDSRSDFLSMAGRYAPNPQGLTSLMGDAEFQQRFPGARVHKNDWLDLGDGSGLIDAIEAYDPQAGTGKRWQWLTEADAIKGKAKEKQGMVNPQALMAADNSSLARIMAELSAASQGTDSPAEREALLAMLQGA